MSEDKPRGTLLESVLVAAVTALVTVAAGWFFDGVQRKRDEKKAKARKKKVER